jgi:hypothetical protein
MGIILPEHLGRDQHNTFGRNMKPLPVFGIVKSYPRTFGNAAATIDQGISDVAVTADLDIRIDDRIRDFTIGMNLNL